MTEENQTQLPEAGRTIAGVLTIMAGSLAGGVVTPAEEPHHHIATLGIVTAWVLSTYPYWRAGPKTTPTVRWSTTCAGIAVAAIWAMPTASSTYCALATLLSLSMVVRCKGLPLDENQITEPARTDEMRRVVRKLNLLFYGILTVLAGSATALAVALGH